jgi:hypothetical protein
VGLAIVADALGSADFQRREHIHDATSAVFGIFAGERDRAMGVCDELGWM